MRAHLAGCAECREVVETAGQIAALADRVRLLECDMRAVRGELRTMKRPSHTGRIVAVAVIVAVLVWLAWTLP